MGRRRAFTLIELLVVIAIMGLLGAFLLPVLSRARYQATNVICVSNIKELTVATTAYCADYKSYYPDRGIGDGVHPFCSVDRWAARERWNAGRGDAYSLIKMMDPYCPTDLGVWCCPLYKGSNYGSTESGLEGAPMRDRTMSYGMHAGIYPWTVGSWDLPLTARVRLGQPFNLRHNGVTYPLRFLWSDGGMNFMNLWTVGRYQGAIGTNHAPPPGVPYYEPWDPGNYGELKVYGATWTTWGYDDASVRSRRVPMLAGSGMTEDWHHFGFQWPTRSVYYPTD